MAVAAANEHYRPGALGGAAWGFEQLPLLGVELLERFCNPISVWRGVLGKTAGPLQLQSPARSARPLRPKPPAGSVQLQPIEVKT